MISKAEIYRQRAEECRRQAEQSPKPSDKERQLKLAEQWQHLA
jgi:hypothetical protein